MYPSQCRVCSSLKDVKTWSSQHGIMAIMMLPRLGKFNMVFLGEVSHSVVHEVSHASMEKVIMII